MTFRVAYGLTHSEAGWRMCDRNECVIPETGDPVVDQWFKTAPVRSGSPAVILGAWALWYHRNVEPIISPIWGWSLVNDVPSSNHLAGVALDINAVKYPWGKRVMPAALIEKVREGLRLFEGTVFWGADWQRADEMHYQLAYREGDSRTDVFAAKLLAGHLGLFGEPDPLAFPLPRAGGPWGPTWYFGPLDGPEQSISGEWEGDRPEWREALRRWQAAAGVPVTGRYDAATKRAAQAVQVAKQWQPAPGNGHIYEGEWNAVVREGFVPDPTILDDPLRQPGLTYADVSQYQGRPVDDSYPYPILMFRVNNGDTIDTLAKANLDAAIRLVEAGKLQAFGVYSFWRPNEDTFGALRRFIGDNPHPRMFAAMVDVEDAAGSSKGPVPPRQDDGANRMVENIRAWLGPKRVMGYLNMRANPQHWTRRPAGVPFVVPDYSAPPGRPRYPYDGWRVHQMTQTGRCAPWAGDVDLNYFSGTVVEFLDMFGLEPLGAEDTAPAPAPAPTQSGEPGMSTRLGPVTGPNTSAVRFGVGGTDLGIARRMPNGRTAVVLGDTFDAMGVGGAGWRSPLILWTDDDTPAELGDGLTFHGAVGGTRARQLWTYNHDAAPWSNGGFSTVLPSDLLVIGGRAYLFVSVCRGLGEVLWTEIAYSDDNGETWTNGGAGATRPGHHEGGFQRGISWELGPDGWVYIVGSTWLIDGGSNVLLYRVRPDDLLDRGKWQGWGWNGTDWGWNRAASGILPPGTRARELNLRYLDGHYVLTYTQTAPSVQVVAKYVRSMTDNMHTAPTSTIVRHTAHELEFLDRDNTLAQPYGGYLVPGSTLDDMHYLVSQWDTRDNWPYHIVQFRHTAPASVPRGLGGSPAPEPAPEPEPSPTPDPEPEPSRDITEVMGENYRLARAILARAGGSLEVLPDEAAADTLEAALDTNEALWRIAVLHNVDTREV